MEKKIHRLSVVNNVIRNTIEIAIKNLKDAIGDKVIFTDRPDCYGMYVYKFVDFENTVEEYHIKALRVHEGLLQVYFGSINYICKSVEEIDWEDEESVGDLDMGIADFFVVPSVCSILEEIGSYLEEENN